MPTKLRFPNEIYVIDYAVPVGRKGITVHTCDTVGQASAWIEENVMEAQLATEGDRYSIDGTPRAWYEQTGECGCLVGESCQACTA